MFLNKAFSSEERSKIIRVKISNPDNAHYGTEGGRDTDDQIFLLSIDEAEKYFVTKDTRKTEPTAYARSNGVWTNDNGYCWWWLRSPGDLQHSAADIYIGGDVSNGGNSVIRDDHAVRPALWINLESDGPWAEISKATLSPEETYKTLSRGMRNSKEVEALQKRLQWLGWFNSEIDADYGQDTVTAIKKFQQAAGLEVTGIADPQTQALLYSDNAPMDGSEAIPEGD